MKIRVVLLVTFGLAMTCIQCSAQINMDLSRLVADDIEARRAASGQPIGLKVLSEDADRRRKALTMLESGQIRVPTDYENAALLFLHGSQPSDYRLAHSLATIANVLRPTRQTQWLVSASWDRLLVSLGRQQWYGTQRKIDATSGELLPLPTDPSVTDVHRAEMGMPPILQKER